MSRKLLLLLCLGLLLGGAACGDDDDDLSDGGPDSGPHDSGIDGAVGSAGRTGSGGMTGGSGGMTGDGGDLYACVPPEPEAGGSAKAGDACCGGLGVCTANASGPGSEGYGLDKCAADKNLSCAPAATTDSDAGDDDGGAAGAIASCRVELPANLGDFDLEGRCVPSCFVTGDATAANLGKSTCDTDSKCVPCFSPVTGKSTGACEQGSDKPAEKAPKGFAACGDNDAGFCVSSDTIGSMGTVMLPQLTCDDGEVCAPKVKVLDQTACFAHCDSMIGGPGACIAAFIIPMANRMLLQKSTCEEGDLCAPCVSPLDKKSTGACDM